MLIREKLVGTIGQLTGLMSVPTPFLKAWGKMCAFTEGAICGPGEHVNIEDTAYNYHDVARNDLLKRFHGDWILMFDTDVVFEPDFAARMVTTMKRYDVDVLTGIYSYKKAPHNPVVYMWNAEEQRHEVISDWDRSCDLFPVGSAGAGCLLVRRHVFERITAELKENPFERIGTKGEDHSFFMRLDKLGIQAYCAWKLEMQHLEYVGIAPSTHFKPPIRLPGRSLEAQGLSEWKVVGKRIEVPA